MATITKFEDLIAWQEARTLVCVTKFSEPLSLRWPILQGIRLRIHPRVCSFSWIRASVSCGSSVLALCRAGCGAYQTGSLQISLRAGEKVQSLDWWIETSHSQESSPCKFYGPLLKRGT